MKYLSLLLILASGSVFAEEPAPVVKVPVVKVPVVKPEPTRGFALTVEPGAVKVVAAEGYKINQEYPHKITLEAAPQGVVLGEVQKPAFDKAALTYTVAAKAERPSVVKGVVKFSVCNDKTCLIEKQAVEIPIP